MKTYDIDAHCEKYLHNPLVLADWKRGMRPDSEKLHEFEGVVMSGSAETFYKNEDMVEFVLVLVHTYGVCGVREKGQVHQSLDEGSFTVFDLVKPA